MDELGSWVCCRTGRAPFLCRRPSFGGARFLCRRSSVGCVPFFDRRLSVAPVSVVGSGLGAPAVSHWALPKDTQHRLCRSHGETARSDRHRNLSLSRPCRVRSDFIARGVYVPTYSRPARRGTTGSPTQRNSKPCWERSFSMTSSSKGQCSRTAAKSPASTVVGARDQHGKVEIFKVTDHEVVDARYLKMCGYLPVSSSWKITMSGEVAAQNVPCRCACNTPLTFHGCHFRHGQS